MLEEIIKKVPAKPTPIKQGQKPEGWWSIPAGFKGPREAVTKAIQNLEGLPTMDRNYLCETIADSEFNSVELTGHYHIQNGKAVLNVTWNFYNGLT